MAYYWAEIILGGFVIVSVGVAWVLFCESRAAHKEGEKR